jgi:hypothetical protein
LVEGGSFKKDMVSKQEEVMNPAEYLAQQISNSGLSKKDWYWQVYLKSDHWHDIRTTALENANHRCKNCGCGGPLDVDHIRYKSIYNVTQDDLQVLCRKCHNAEHEGRRDARRINRKERKPKESRKKQEQKTKQPFQMSPRAKARAQVRKMKRLYEKTKKKTEGVLLVKAEAGQKAVMEYFATLESPSAQEKRYTDELQQAVAKIRRKS